MFGQRSKEPGERPGRARRREHVAEGLLLPPQAAAVIVSSHWGSDPEKGSRICRYMRVGRLSLDLDTERSALCASATAVGYQGPT